MASNPGSGNPGKYLQLQSVVEGYNKLMYMHIAAAGEPKSELAQPLPQTPSIEPQTSAAKANDDAATAGGPKVKTEKECTLKTLPNFSLWKQYLQSYSREGTQKGRKGSQSRSQEG